MSIVFLTNTPYHIIISCGFASLYDEDVNKILIIVSDFKDAALFKEIVTRWEKNPFSDVVLLSGRYDINKDDKLGIALNARRNIRILKRMGEKSESNKICTPLVPPYHLFVFNDQNPEAQYLAFLNKNDGTNTYIEDGFAAYGISTSSKMALYQKIIAKVLWGNYYDKINVLGTYRFIHNIMVFKPRHVRDELKRKKLIQLPEDVLFVLNQNGFTTECLRNYNFNDDILEKKDCILILPLSDDLKKCRDPEKLKYLVDIIKTSYCCFTAKYHPRETLNDYLHLGNYYDNVGLLPQALPLEIIYLSLMGSEPKVIIGLNSTSIFTARIVFKKSKIISISKILYGYDPLEHIYHYLDILSPANFEEFRDILKNK